MRSESQEKINNTLSEMQFEAMWLKYDFVMDLRSRQWGTNLNTTTSTLSQGRYRLEITRNRGNNITGPIVMIREFENTGTVFSPNYVPRWTTLYDGVVPLIIINHRTQHTAVFDRNMQLLHASPNWDAQINAVDSIWGWPIWTALLELVEQPRMNANDYINNLRRREQ